MEDIRKQFDGLVAAYGPEKVKALARELLQVQGRPIPAEHIPVISADMLEKTVRQLDRALNDVQTAGARKEAAYQNKADLFRQQTSMETEVKLAEADAFMRIEGEGRDQYVMEGSRKVPLNNDAARDAFRRRSSAGERRQLADLNAQINAIDVGIATAGDAWFTAKEAVESIRAKANLQAALLNFLAGRVL